MVWWPLWLSMTMRQLMIDAHCYLKSMQSDHCCHIARSPSIVATICHFSLWRLCWCYFLGWTELFGTPSQSHLAMDAPQLRAQLASVEILLDQWLTWEFYSLCDKQAAAFPLLPSVRSRFLFDFVSMRYEARNTAQWILIKFMLIECVVAHKVHCTEFQ